ncbi:MAG TPA: hypothetical protein ENG92_06130 [Thiolapillus brandeum]|uniref:Chalcone isomerase domain-containing protein n=1 Tax=Thiolapillus brandeum TaxID=1076588 RepID=A0A831NWA4_9GAMM|nr:hypothetical protein [Thiolapillus brandeum]
MIKGLGDDDSVLRKKTSFGALMRWLSILLVGLLPAMLAAKTVEGVKLPDQASVDGKVLVLNGAGIREKFFFDIYVAALYLPVKASDASQILQADQLWQLTMHFLYSEVSKKKLDKGWDEGFAKNISITELVKLKKGLQQFKDMFPDLQKGDEVALAYAPGKGVSVIINEVEKGTVAGADFGRSLAECVAGCRTRHRKFEESAVRGPLKRNIW